MKHSTFNQYPAHRARLTLVCMLIAAIAALMPAGAPHPALAQATVPVYYDALNNIIYVGSNYNPADPYAGNPSHPLAPKTPITIPQIATALNNPALLQDQGGGAWLLKANMVISQTTRLEATKASIAWLRLDSTPGATFPALTSMTARGGHLLIHDIKMTSGDGNNVHTNYYARRSYLLPQS